MSKLLPGVSQRICTRKIFSYVNSIKYSSIKRCCPTRPDFTPRHYQLINTFKTSTKKQAAPVVAPLLLKLSTGISRLLAILLGRYLRKWWRGLPPKEKSKIYGAVYRNRIKLAFACSIGSGSLTGYYLWNSETVPLTGRRRFRVITKEQVLEIAEKQGQEVVELFRDCVLSSDDVRFKNVKRVVETLLRANKEMPMVTEITWEVNVLDSEEVNAFVLPTGQIFVMTGMLALTQSADELAGVLGHEIAHVLLEHTAEQLSFSGFFSIISLGLIASLWAVAPTDFFAILTHWLQNQIQQILIHMPYSRKLETEADYIGLMLAAKSCYDVRQIPLFWKRMSDAEDQEPSAPKVIEWLSTHPTHSRRADFISNNLTDALTIRSYMECPRLQEFFKAAQL